MQGDAADVTSSGLSRTRPCSVRPPAPSRSAHRSRSHRSRESPAQAPHPHPTRGHEHPPWPPGSRPVRSRRPTAPPAAPSRRTPHPEQRRLAGERRQVRHAPAAVGQHHRQIAEHPPRLVPRTPLPRAPERVAQPTSQTDTISDQHQQRGPRPRGQTSAVRPDIYRLDTPTSHHLQGEPPERSDRLFASRILPAQADVSGPLARQPPALLTNRG